MWRRPLAYLLFGLGFLTVTYFRNYHGDIIPYPILFWIAGLLLFWGGFLFLRFTPTSNEIKIQKQIADTIADLKKNGEQIKVDLASCEIKEHSYTEEKERYGHSNEILTLGIEREIQALNALGSSMNNSKQVEITQSVIIFSKLNTRTGQIEKFISRVIPKDRITLMFYMDRQKETVLYVDKTNRENYYFDLDFIKS